MGWIIFAGVFAVGVMLIISGVVYEVMIGGEEARDLPARALALSGIILVFGSIYGAAGWRFSLWWRTREPEKPDQKH
jgi:O-antigen/teichoic acid export membrane protein